MKKVHTKSFGQVTITSRESYTSFFDHFASSYSPSQKHKLAAIVDRIVEDTTRRKQGEFFTPVIWVNKAHEYISSVYGDDWKEKYVVWDPAWGTGNLTRDYQFKELYVSTLVYADIQTAEQMGYNPEATKFQFDFLNDDYEKLPVGLRTAIESGKQIIILMNPPYAAAGEKSKKNDAKTGVNDTMVRKLMISNEIGRCTEQLYAQFLYRFLTMGGQINISFFSPPLYLTGQSYDKLRKLIFSSYTFEKSFMIDASNFADVKSWGLTFSILKKIKNENL
jgi:hypothetical protein